jgi:SAM-dependent methyltransferase
MNRKCFAVGFDINKHRLAQGKGTNLICADVAHPPFKPNSFTKVFFTEVLEHLPDEDVAFRNIRIVLKNGGLLILSTPRRVLFNLWDPAWIRWKLVGDRLMHKHYSITQLRAKLFSHGFVIEKLHVLNSPKWLLAKWLNVLIKFFGGKRLLSYDGKIKGHFDILVIARVEKDESFDNL